MDAATVVFLLVTGRLWFVVTYGYIYRAWTWLRHHTFLQKHLLRSYALR